MRIFLTVLAVLVFGISVSAGTLIYKNKDGEQKRVSGLTIISIDGKKMVVRIKNGTETIFLSQVVKYYDTDIRVGGEFDDDSGDYTVRLGMEKLTRNKKNNRMEFTIPFSINRTGKTKIGSRVRQPYFYLFVLCSDGENAYRKMHTFSYPAAAKNAMKNYDEAKMLEKVISLDRPYIYDSDVPSMNNSVGRSLGNNRMAVFPLSSIRNGSVIAWYLVVWGKDSIVETKEWHDPARRVGKNWWIR